MHFHTLIETMQLFDQIEAQLGSSEGGRIDRAFVDATGALRWVNNQETVPVVNATRERDRTIVSVSLLPGIWIRSDDRILDAIPVGSDVAVDYTDGRTTRITSWDSEEDRDAGILRIHILSKGGC